MKQFRFIPSGCQFWHKHIISAAGDYFAFCSTMAIYIVRINDMQVEKILASHEHTIVSISWSLQDPSHLASCGADGWVYIWDIDKERVIAKKNLGSCPLQLEFAPLEEDLVGVVLDTGDIKLYDTVKDKLDKILGYDGAKLMRWNHMAAGRLAVGTKGGLVAIYSTKTKKTIKTSFNQESAIEDLQWDPNSQNYLLACWKDGNLSLVDGDSGTEMQKFEKQGAGITCIAWLKNVPGGFVTCNEKISALKIWNVSNKSPQHTIKAGDSPLVNIFSMFNTNYGKEGFLLTFKNGSVGVFNYNKRALDFMTQPNHSETIFDMAFKPSDKDILATGSFDGSIKIWEISQMKCILSLQKANPNLQNEQSKVVKGYVVYSLAWAPGQLNQLISVNAKGEVLLWDTVKGKLLHEISPGSENPIYRADWSAVNPNLVAVGHSDGHCYILGVNNNTLSNVAKLKHPEGVFGVAWNPFNKNQIATGCSDGIVRVWDHTIQKMIVQLKGHTARSFNVAWNPLIANCLASGGDDCTVRVWDVKSQNAIVLTGHKNYVRGLVWNTELPWLLLSGSWDSSIITWDVRDSKILHVAKEHNADVYGVVSHPERPFVYVSCSRDTSVRFWSIGKIVAALALRIIITNDWDDILGIAPVDISSKSDLLKFCGNASRRVASGASSISSDMVDYYEKVLDFFSYMDYQREFWDISKANIKNKTEDPTNRVVSLTNLPALYLSKAQEIESKGNTTGFTYDALNKKSDRILEAANMYLKLGEFELYCEALVKLGKWEKALAFAPAVSYEYWKALAKRYSQELASEGSDELGSYYIVSGQTNEAIKFYVERGDFEDARLLSALKINNKFAHLEASDRYQQKFKVNETIKIDSQSFNSPEIREIVGNLAEDAMKANQPLLAASYHLSILDGNSAVLKLLRANEPLYAFAICKLYNLEMYSQVAMILAQRADKIGERFLGNILLNQLKDKTCLEIFCANTPLSNKEANDLYIQNGLSNIAKYEADAQKCMEKGNVIGAVKFHVLSKNIIKACTLAVDTAVDCIKNRRVERILELPDIFQILSYGQIHSLTDFNRLKFEVIAFSLYLGLKKAMWKGYYPIVPYIYNILRTFLEERKNQINFPINIQEIELEVTNYEALLKPEETYTKITGLVKDLQNEAYKTSATNMAKNIKDVIGNESRTTLKKQLEKDLNKHKIYIPGTNLPSQVNSNELPVSFLSRKPIRSEIYVLEDARSLITLEEALMWADCCYLSPLPTGFNISPF